LKELAAPLAGWEKGFSSIAATEAMQTRWAKGVQQATETSTSLGVSRSSSSGPGFLRRVWRELIWPSRYAWSGLAALWVGMLVVNRHLAEPTRATSSSSPQAILQAWKERSTVFAEWERPTSPGAPAHLPRPRSQKEQDWTLI
jgi:hypothetical protein